MGWRRFFRRADADLDHEAEFQAHLAFETDENLARGMPPAEARAAARRKLGNMTLLREEAYHMNTLGFVETLGQDLRYAVRTLRKNPGFTATAVATLALGLGANAAIFSIVDAVLLKPLPYPDPERLVMVFEKPPGGFRNAVSPLNFLDWKDQSKTIDMAAAGGSWHTMTGRGDPQRVISRQVGADYFQILGSPTATGRTFLPEEGRPENSHVVILSHRFWFEKLGGDPAILGKTIVLDNALYKVIGTLPANSWFDRHPADVWMPLPETRGNANRDFHFLQVYGRLRPGVTMAAARAEMDNIAARIARDFPASNKDWGITIDPLVDRVVAQQLRQSLQVAFLAVGAVLLIACVNLANLLLARSAVRERELWVRMSIGAGRRRLIRQFLTESVVLALVGGLAGCAVGYGLQRALMAGMPPFTLPTQAEVHLDWRVTGFLFVISVIAGLLFGLAPALAAGRKDVAGGLREGARGSTGSHKLRHALIVAEVALSFILVATAGVLIHSFMRLTGVDLGVRSENILSMQLPRAMQRDTDGAREIARMNRLRESVGGVPGVLDAALTSAMPLQGWGFGMPLKFPGINQTGGGGFKIVSPSYFQAMGMHILTGRGLVDSDRAGAPPAIVINNTLAKRHFKDQSPIGQTVLIQRIITGKHELGPWVPWQIVGVVSDERTGNLEDTFGAGGYVTFDQSPIIGMGMVVRTQGDPLRARKSIQEAIWAVNKDQLVVDMKPLEQIKSESSAGRRFNTTLLSGFAMLALLLAAVGIYGVVSYSVMQRTREMGIRAALGASRGSLLGLALRSSIVLAAIGLAVGAAAIHWSGKLIASMLFQTNPAEPSTLVAVGAILATTVIAASLVPARKAAKTDPAVALRHE
jgi:putative ABC transport system permease protein